MFDKIYKAKISKTSMTEQKETGMNNAGFCYVRKIVRRLSGGKKDGII